MATTNAAQVGYAENFDGLIHATLWYGTPSSCIDLNPPGAEESWTTDIDGNIQVGYARFGSGTRGGLWVGSAATWLDLTPPGAASCMVNSVAGNVQGGYSIIAGSRHAGYWQGTANSWVDLHPSGASSSSISCVSGPLKIGYAVFGGVKHVGVWTDSADSWLDLHLLVGATFNPIESWGVTGYSDGTSFIVHGLVRRPLNMYSAFSWSGPVPNRSYSLTLNKSSVAGENSVLGTIARVQPNTVSTDFTVYDNSSLVLTPGKVTLPSLTTSKSFQIKVSPVNSSIATTIYAKQGSSIRSQVLTLLPLVPTALAFTPNPAQGGSVVTGRVVINGVAGPGGRTISLFDNSVYAATPKAVTVPPGANQANFDIQTASVSSPQIVSVTARVSAGEKTGTFRLAP